MRRSIPRAHVAARLPVIAAMLLALTACRAEPPAGPTTRTEEPAIPASAPVTPGERRGEEIYLRENCGRCHTRFDHPGPQGRTGLPAGPSVDLLDSRVGPDLGLEGHRHDDDWHFAHLYSPGLLVPGSRMPASRHLFRPDGERSIPTQEGLDLVAYLQSLGHARRDVWAEWRSHEPEVPAPPPADDILRRRGVELYRTHCASCHGDAGDGRGDLADFFAFPPRDLVAARYRFKSTRAGAPPRDEDLFRTITLGTGTGAGMPGFYWLDGRDRWALVLAVKGFSPRLRGTGLRVDPAPQDVSAEGGSDGVPGREDNLDRQRGGRLWDDLGCAACHGSSGEGMTPGEAHTAWTDETGREIPRSGDLTHACALRGGASPRAVERALLFGVGGSMPSYADSLADAQQRRALISFVLSLERDRTPGR